MADERSAAAYEFLVPNGWEIYGRPNVQAVDTIRTAAEAAGVTLKVQAEHVAGFMRLAGDVRP